MQSSALLERLGPNLAHIRGSVSENERMSKFTWFRTGGAAQVLFIPADSEDLKTFLKLLPEDVPIEVVGIGSNILVRDGGVGGVVIRLSAKGFGDLTHIGGNKIYAGSALSDKKLALFAYKQKIGGFHAFYGIPGSVGGALRMNAGANGVETSQLVEWVYAINRQGEEVKLSQHDMGFHYRHSDAPKDLIFIGAQFLGHDSDEKQIDAAMQEVAQHRASAQPIREKTGGSTFRNPPGHSAWRLIDEAGCRGLTIGGAKMSEQHCNFMINSQDASAFDLELLGQTVIKRVYEHSGILLQWEICRIGQFATQAQAEQINALRVK